MKTKVFGLTPEQKKYVDLFYKDKWAKAIGEHLGVSPHMVLSYMKSQGYPPRKDCKQNTSVNERVVFKETYVRDNETFFNVDGRKGEYTWLV